MARILNVNLSGNKKVFTGLNYIYGIGKKLAEKICKKTNINKSKYLDDLTDKENELLRSEVSKYIIEGDLRRLVLSNIKRLKDINCYRGIRHKKKLPVRGQRTRTNAKTIKFYKKARSKKKIKKNEAKNISNRKNKKKINKNN